MRTCTDSPDTTLFSGATYAEALASVLADPGTRYRLRQRIREDQAADPIDCLADALLLLALNQLRLDELLAQARVGKVH